MISPFRISPPPRASGLKIFETQVGDPLSPARFSSTPTSFAVHVGIWALAAFLIPRREGNLGSLMSFMTVITAGSEHSTTSRPFSSIRSTTIFFLAGSISLTLATYVSCGIPEAGGNAGTHLGRIAVDGLFPTDDQVHAPDLLDRLGERIRRRQRIRACKSAIREEIDLVRSDGGRILQDIDGLRGPHGDDMHLSAMFLLRQEALFQGELVKRVGDACHTLSHERVRLWIDLHLRRLRYLLDTDYDLHFILLIFLDKLGFRFSRNAFIPSF